MDLERRNYNIRYVAIYIRKSRAESIDDLEKHRLVLVDLCKKNNFKYVEYPEVGTSDSIDLRPQICKLLKEVAEGVYDAVCVVEYDRLGRGDLGEQDRIKKAFQKSNTLIITPDKIYDLNDELDDTYADFKGFFARQEYKMITKRLRQGKKIGARRGQWTNGIPPFPYVYERYKDKYNSHGIVVDDERYKIYRHMVEQALNGIPPQKIAEELNRKGILTARSKCWSGVTVQRLLEDETHLGKIISNKSRGDGHKVRRPNSKEQVMLPRSEWVIVENCHEAIKTQEEHDKILYLISSRRQVNKKSRHQAYAFTGLIKCGKCGHFHTFYTREGMVFMKPCWFINPTGSKCANSGIKMSIIEDLVLSEICKYREEFLHIPSFSEDGSNNIQTLIDERETSLSKQIRALEIVNDAYENGDYSRQEWLSRKKKREDEIFRIKDALYDLRKQLKATAKVSLADRQSMLSDFFENITQAADQPSRNSLYRSIIDSIVWFKDGDDSSITINFK